MEAGAQDATIADRREAARRGRARRGTILLGGVAAVLIAGRLLAPWAHSRADHHARAVEARVHAALSGVTFEQASDPVGAEGYPSVEARLADAGADAMGATFGGSSVSIAVDATRAWLFWEPRCVRVDVGIASALQTTLLEADAPAGCLREVRD